MPERSGRYEDIYRAPIPGELPAEGKRGAQISIRHGKVADPNPSLRGQKQRVAINRQTDALEYEYSRGRISDAAYLAGRAYQALLERSRTPISGMGQWNPGNRVDMVISHELAILKKIVAAENVVDMLRDTRRATGMLGEQVLALVLIDGLTIKQVAERFGGTHRGLPQDAKNGPHRGLPQDAKSGPHRGSPPQDAKKSTGTNEIYFWGETFRRSLEGLADHWCGPRTCAPRCDL